MLFGASSAPFLTLAPSANGPPGSGYTVPTLVFGGSELTVAVTFMLPSAPSGSGVQVLWLMISAQTPYAPFFSVQLTAGTSYVMGRVMYNYMDQSGGTQVMIAPNNTMGGYGGPLFVPLMQSTAGTWVTAALSISSAGAVSLYARSSTGISSASSSARRGAVAAREQTVLVCVAMG